jgi:hypothetical protein
MGEGWPKFGEAFPNLGEEFPNLGEVFPGLGGRFPKSREALPDFGEGLPSWREVSPDLGEVFPVVSDRSADSLALQEGGDPLEFRRPTLLNREDGEVERNQARIIAHLLLQESRCTSRRRASASRGRSMILGRSYPCRELPSSQSLKSASLTSPLARPKVRRYLCSPGAWRRQPLSSRKTSAAVRAMRLFPSTKL